MRFLESARCYNGSHTESELIINHDYFSSSEQGAVYVHVEGSSDLAIEFDNLPGLQLQELPYGQEGTAHLDGYFHLDAR